MQAITKTILKGAIDSAVILISKTTIGRYLYSQIINNAMSLTQEVAHHGVSLIFSTPNPLNKFRADTFSTKEPETLEWLDNIPENSVVWDIGANIGLYSCYAAKARNCRVFAFEPSVFNLELLARNIYLNKLTELVTIIPLPLCEHRSFSKLNMTSTDWGGALSTFGNSYGYNGKPLRKTFEFATIGISISEAMELLKIPKPDYIKIDVDGIEHLVLKGATAVLPNVQSVLVEIDDDFQQQTEDATHYLITAGFRLKEKCRWKEADNSPFETTYNQIWHQDHGQHT